MRCTSLHQFISGTMLGVLLLGLAMSPCQADEIKSFYVYDDAENPKYLWSPSGWMPDGGGIVFTDEVKENCHSGTTCIKIGFNAQHENNWVGIYWLPEPGQWKGPGINLYEKLQVEQGTPVKLTFWAKGMNGGEQAQFKVGGVADGNDSIPFPAETDYLTLEQEWQQYEIDLSEEDLSNVVGGFCWVTNKAQNPDAKAVWLFLDDIRYEVK